ncbi:hypothetical protein CMQ_274 [Grosmannia clavigera kw1407]|uniref:Uncharacterized protein n=1 Tax=Grosmannia clavigera (strain kw1407 / UAMH 11150) TaxID=655863 RepID=F0XRG0_GROCL|nr:uncharacterized protein CMQ_274 [Grosmannia clavigera kw1407]EFW99956.1 hypothetical protein CMQ_274 [Grosmannia clavigera kw1407]
MWHHLPPACHRRSSACTYSDTSCPASFRELFFSRAIGHFPPSELRPKYTLPVTLLRARAQENRAEPGMPRRSSRCQGCPDGRAWPTVLPSGRGYGASMAAAADSSVLQASEALSVGSQADHRLDLAPGPAGGNKKGKKTQEGRERQQ